MSEIKFNIERRLAVLSETENGYSKQLNIVVWNKGQPQLDIRMWKMQQDGTQKPLKGIVVSMAETEALMNALKEFFDSAKERKD